MSEDFSQEQLEKAWQKHALQYKTDIPNLYVTLTSRKPILKEDHLVEYEVDNKTQQETINEKKTGLVEDLRKELKNNKIQVSLHISEKQEEKRNPYSPDEKYKRMAEKNPAIKQFRNQLGLDIEF